VRGESAAALRYWWGITCSAVCLWRNAQGVEGPGGTEGSRRRIRGAAEKGAAALRGKHIPPQQVDRGSRAAPSAVFGRDDVEALHRPRRTTEASLSRGLQTPLFPGVPAGVRDEGQNLRLHQFSFVSEKG
jgi:hypothetical protein